MLKLNSLSGFGSGAAGAGGVLYGAGYFCGGRTTGVANASPITDKIVFATGVTAANTDATLTVGRGFHMGITNPTGGSGYIMGGTTPPSTWESPTTCDQITYATETTAANTDVVLSAASRWGQTAGYSNDSGGAGYVTGGNTGARTAQTAKLTFATDTFAIATDANLGTAIKEGTAVSNNGVAGDYFGGDL